VAFLYLGGLAFLVGAAVALLVASSWRRGWLLVWLGASLAAAFFAYEWSQASNGRDARGCHDCQMFLGRYWQWYLVAFFAVVNWFWWSIGVALGGGARAMLSARRQLREQRGAA
jgi:hypothetical protein